MPYRFKRKEKVAQSVRRILTEQSRRAAGKLCGENPDIHDARKAFKKIRGLLRLVRFELGERVYKRENRWFRDAARRLSSARDAEAMVETYDKLAKRYPEQFEEAALAPLRRALVERRERSAGPEQNLSGEAREIAEALELRLSRVKEWDLSGKQRFKKLSRGVEQSYSRGRKAFRRAMASMDDEHFHEWRKRVKDFWYQTRLLSRVWPEMMDARARQLKWLSELLGDDHDLSMLRETLDREGETLGSGAARLSGLALQRQRELRRESEILGRRLYAMQPSCTADQLAALWKAWKPG